MDKFTIDGQDRLDLIENERKVEPNGNNLNLQI